MRAFPAGSLEYFGDTTLGKTALPAAAGAVLGGAAAFFEAAGAAGATGAGAGVAALASGPHSALRKSFHFTPLAVPAACAALYLALHSCMVSACTDGATVATAMKATAQMAAQRIIMADSPLLVFFSRTDSICLALACPSPFRRCDFQ